AVYDMGGGTFDITILEIQDGVFHVRATNGSTFLGGEDFNNCIVDWLLDEFKRESGVDLGSDKLAMQRLREAAEQAKKELSFTLESNIHLPFIISNPSGSQHLKKVITRDLLEKLTGSLVDSSFPFISQALDDSRLEPGEIDEVILVGGQTRMPLIKEKIKDYFKKEPLSNPNPEEMVAMGAAVQAGVISGDLSSLIVLLDVTPLSLGIETENGIFTRIIEKNTTIPVKETKQFTTVEHNQRRVRVHVLQGENELAKDNTSLAVFNLVGIEEAPVGVPQIDVTFEIDADGIVKVSAMDVATKRQHSVEVKPSSGLQKHEIDQIMSQQTEMKEQEDDSNDEK
ncbi:MAG TPA: molecular chaperone DnaK, partial [Salinimicrobium catena]|nr:molecular chaperone DnaK [Salinimicrobium catena]